jgi:hypothetical protein
MRTAKVNFNQRGVSVTFFKEQADAYEKSYTDLAAAAMEIYNWRTNGTVPAGAKRAA